MPACEHHSAEWEGARPQCGERRCVLRWWWWYMFPILTLLVAFVIFAYFQWHTPGCPPGWEPQGTDACVRR